MIVRHLVEAHGGRVRAGSRGRGRGATFVVDLPLKDRAVAADTTGSRLSAHVEPVDTEFKTTSSEMISTGVTGPDDLLGGGTLRGNVLMVAGPSGSGKTTLATQFIAEGVKQGEPGVIAVFEETPPKYAEQANGFGFDMQKMIRNKQVELVYVRPLDLSVDETLYEIQQAVDRVNAKRVVIDSLTALEIAVAPPFQEDIRESLYRLLGALTGAGISVVMSIEITESYTAPLRWQPARERRLRAITSNNLHPILVRLGSRGLEYCFVATQPSRAAG